MELVIRNITTEDSELNDKLVENIQIKGSKKSSNKLCV